MRSSKDLQNPFRATARSRAAALAILALAGLGCLGFVVSPAAAQVSAEIVIGNAPPPTYVEPVPAPRMGYVWAPGYWYWDGRQYLWYQGHWEIERPGYFYAPAEWVETPAGWRFVAAHWEDHDRRWDDHDRRRDDQDAHWRPDHCPPGHEHHDHC